MPNPSTCHFPLAFLQEFVTFSSCSMLLLCEAGRRSGWIQILSKFFLFSPSFQAFSRLKGLHKNSDVDGAAYQNFDSFFRFVPEN